MKWKLTDDDTGESFFVDAEGTEPLTEDEAQEAFEMFKQQKTAAPAPQQDLAAGVMPPRATTDASSTAAQPFKPESPVDAAKDLARLGVRRGVNTAMQAAKPFQRFGSALAEASEKADIGKQLEVGTLTEEQMQGPAEVEAKFDVADKTYDDVQAKFGLDQADMETLKKHKISGTATLIAADLIASLPAYVIPQAGATSIAAKLIAKYGDDAIRSVLPAITEALAKKGVDANKFFAEAIGQTAGFGTGSALMAEDDKARAAVEGAGMGAGFMPSGVFTNRLTRAIATGFTTSAIAAGLGQDKQDVAFNTGMNALMAGFTKYGMARSMEAVNKGTDPVKLQRIIDEELKMLPPDMQRALKGEFQQLLEAPREMKAGEGFTMANAPDEAMLKPGAAETAPTEVLGKERLKSELDNMQQEGAPTSDKYKEWLARQENMVFTHEVPESVVPEAPKPQEAPVAEAEKLEFADMTTVGFEERGDYRKSTDDAVAELNEGKISNVAYAASDMTNLTKLNKVVGNIGANELMQKFGGIWKETIIKNIPEGTPIKFGRPGAGDEFSAIAKNITEDVLGPAVKTADEAVAAEVRNAKIKDKAGKDVDLTEVVHPKNDRLKTGAGFFNSGVAEMKKGGAIRDMVALAEDRAALTSDTRLKAAAKKALDNGEIFLYNREEGVWVNVDSLIGRMISENRNAGKWKDTENYSVLRDRAINELKKEGKYEFYTEGDTAPRPGLEKEGAGTGAEGAKEQPASAPELVASATETAPGAPTPTVGDLVQAPSRTDPTLTVKGKLLGFVGSGQKHAKIATQLDAAGNPVLGADGKPAQWKVVSAADMKVAPVPAQKARRSTSKKAKAEEPPAEPMGPAPTEPKATTPPPSEGKKTRSFAETVTEQTPLKFEDIPQEGREYSPQGHEETMNKANAILAQGDEAAERFAMEGSKERGAERVVVATKLIDKYERLAMKNEGAARDEYHKRAGDIAAKIATDETIAGQTIEAVKIIDRLSPEGVAAWALKRGKTNDVDFGPELSVKLKDLTETYQKMPKGREKIEAGMRLAQAMALTNRPANAWQKASSLMKSMLLLGPKTFVRNIIGNQMLYSAERLLTNPVMGAIDWSRSKLTGQDRAIVWNPASDRKWMSDYLADLKLGAKAGRWGVDVEGVTSQAELKGLAFEPNRHDGALRKAMETAFGAIEKTIGIALKAPDYADFKRAKDLRLAQIAHAEALNQKVPKADIPEFVRLYIENADKNLVKFADNFGMNMTYQTDNVATEAAKKVKQFINTLTTLGRSKDFGLAETNMPFARTPINIIATGIEYSPIGILKGMLDLRGAVKAYDAAVAKGRNTATAKELLRQAEHLLARGLVGSGAIGLPAFILGYAGAMTAGKGEAAGKDVEKIKRTTTGQRNYQINLSMVKRLVESFFEKTDVKDAVQIKEGDVLYPYDWMLPFSMTAAMFASAGQQNKRYKDQPSEYEGKFESAVEAAGAFVKPITEQPLMTGVRNLMGKYDENQLSILARAMVGIPAMFVPQIVNNVKTYTDNVSRETYAKNKMMQAWNMVLAKTPYFSKGLPARTNIATGKPMQQYRTDDGKRLGILQAFLYPAVMEKYDIDPVIASIIEPYETLGDTKQVPKTVTKDIPYTVYDVVVDGKSMERVDAQNGAAIEKALDKYKGQDPIIRRTLKRDKYKLDGAEIQDLQRLSAEYMQGIANEKGVLQALVNNDATVKSEILGKILSSVSKRQKLALWRLRTGEAKTMDEAWSGVTKGAVDAYKSPEEILKETEEDAKSPVQLPKRTEEESDEQPE